MTCAPRALNEAQQALAMQWQPMAFKIARGFLRRYAHLRRQEEDVLAEALVGLVEGVQRWEPERGSVAACVGWWVAARLHTFQRRGSRCVPGVKPKPWKRPPPRAVCVSLDAAIGDSGDTFHEIQPGPFVDPSDAIDCASLAADAQAELARRKLRRSQRDTPADVARAMRDAEVFIRHSFHGATLESIAGDMGMTREGVRQCVLKMQPLFDAWASSLRNEAVSGSRRARVRHGGDSP
ncbi:sigma factor [Myxococcus sp. 1LA]